MLVDMTIEGTIGTALTTMHLLEGLRSSIDLGSFGRQVEVFGVPEQDAIALKDLLAEAGFQAKIQKTKIAP